jgi:hypothetical protein
VATDSQTVCAGCRDSIFIESPLGQAAAFAGTLVALENTQGQLEELLKGQESVFAQVWCHGQLLSQTSLLCSAIVHKANDGG